MFTACNRPEASVALEFFLDELTTGMLEKLAIPVTYHLSISEQYYLCIKIRAGSSKEDDEGV